MSQCLDLNVSSVTQCHPPQNHSDHDCFVRMTVGNTGMKHMGTWLQLIYIKITVIRLSTIGKIRCSKISLYGPTCHLLSKTTVHGNSCQCILVTLERNEWEKSQFTGKNQQSHSLWSVKQAKFTIHGHALLVTSRVTEKDHKSREHLYTHFWPCTNKRNKCFVVETHIEKQKQKNNK